MTVTHKPITHPALPGAVFTPCLDTNGRDVAYWGAHACRTDYVVCETVITEPGAEPRFAVETGDINRDGGLTLPELAELVGTLNTYYAAVMADCAALKGAA